jgi:endonuclease III
MRLVVSGRQALGLGYRARFVRETAAALMAKTTNATEDAAAAVDEEGAQEDAGASVAAREAEGRAWLYGLRDPLVYDRAAVQRHLMTFTGVGQKVADCAALFALDQSELVPVDVHVWRIACRDLDPTLLEAKSVTPQVYDRVGDLFRAKYPNKAGWAHSLLFAAELPGFIDLIPDEVTPVSLRRGQWLAVKNHRALEFVRSTCEAHAPACVSAPVGSGWA